MRMMNVIVEANAMKASRAAIAYGDRVTMNHSTGNGTSVAQTTIDKNVSAWASLLSERIVEGCSARNVLGMSVGKDHRPTGVVPTPIEIPGRIAVVAVSRTSVLRVSSVECGKHFVAHDPRVGRRNELRLFDDLRVVVKDVIRARFVLND